MNLKAKSNLLGSFPFTLSLLFTVFTLNIHPAYTQDTLTISQQNEMLSNRIIPWNPGLVGGIPDVPVVANVKTFGAVGDGKTDDTMAFRSAIAAVTNGAILIPAGEYRLTGELLITTSIVLRGEGADKTRLIFDMVDNGVPLRFWRYTQDWQFIRIVAGHEAGSTMLTLEDTSSLAVGDFVDLVRDNDPEVMYTNPTWNIDWAIDAVGQVVQIKA